MNYDPSGHIAISTIILLSLITIGAISGGAYAYNKAKQEGCIDGNYLDGLH